MVIIYMDLQTRGKDILLSITPYIYPRRDRDLGNNSYGQLAVTYTLICVWSSDILHLAQTSLQAPKLE